VPEVILVSGASSGGCGVVGWAYLTEGVSTALVDVGIAPGVEVVMVRFAIIRAEPLRGALRAGGRESKPTRAVTCVLGYARGGVMERLGAVAVAQHEAVAGVVALADAADCDSLGSTQRRLHVGAK
jgi:hypothetical protein